MSFCRFFGISGEVYPSTLAASDFIKSVRGDTRQAAPSVALNENLAK